MATIRIPHHPELSAETAQAVFENHFRGKYKVYPTARLVAGDFIVEKNPVLAIFVKLRQKEGQTSFKFFHQYPTVWMRLLLGILFPVSLVIALTAGKRLENEIRDFIESEPAFGARLQTGAQRPPVERRAPSPKTQPWRAGRQESAVRCPECGMPSAEGARFCMECGTVLPVPQPPPHSQVPRHPVRPVRESQARPPAEQGFPVKALLIGMVAGAIVAAAVALLLLWPRGDGVETVVASPVPEAGRVTVVVTPVPPTAAPTPTSSPIPTTGSISGMVLGDDGRPLLDASDPEILIVALFCSSDDSDVECLDESFWEMDQDVLLHSICEAEDTSSDCLLHFGQGAALVEADGSYTIADLPPGQYNVVFFFPALTLLAAEYDLSVQAGGITKHDFIMEFHRSD